jgi:hypothetical protein
MVLLSHSGVTLKRCDYVQSPCLSILSTNSHSEEMTVVLQHNIIRHFEVANIAIFIFCMVWLEMQLNLWLRSWQQ